MNSKFRLALAATVFTFGMSGDLLAAVEGMPPVARDQVVVHDYAVTLGDLFLNAGDKAGVPVATAPAPGGRELFDAARLTAIASRHGLEWEPAGRSDRVMIERASRQIDADSLASLVEAALEARNPAWKFEVELSNRLQSLQIPTASDVGASVESLQVDIANRRVSAWVVAPDGQKGVVRTEVSGRLFDVTDVPVLRHSVMPGEIITDADVEWTTVRTDRIRRGAVTDLRRIVGLTPRRPLTPGTTLSQRDLEERIVVEKGALVTIVYRTPNMTLSTLGRALDDGADGAPIRVVNTQSDRTIEAVVAGPDRVEIQPVSTLAFNQGYSR